MNSPAQTDAINAANIDGIVLGQLAVPGCLDACMQLRLSGGRG